LRLFVALQLDEKAKDLLADIQQRLAALDRAVRWVQPESIHLTLKFLGEVPDERVPQVAEALDALGELRSFLFEMEGIGYFGNPRSPRVIWTGIRMPNVMLTTIQKKCEDVLAVLGFPPEARAYLPHLTLGRVKDFHAARQIIQAVEGVKSQASEQVTQTATEVTLFQSILRPEGPEYAAAHKILLRKE
jgi:2'-5' RNA ligase